jgi:hypothetical protein
MKRFFALLIVLASPLIAAERKTENVVLVTLDGLRWQELFAGADEKLIDREAGGVGNTGALRERFWRDTPEQRRETLMPFFWSVVAPQGQVFGDPESGSRALVTNGKNFSYPGYNEILVGKPDDRIDSNDKVPNPNVTVLEWVHAKPGYAGRVGAFASWDVFPWIINEERSGVYVNAGWEPFEQALSDRRLAELDKLQAEIPHYWAGVRFDIFTLEGALGYLDARRPRLLYIAFGETDDWAHDRRYDLYLDAARRTDDYLRRLWQTLQASRRYRDKTTLVITTDHGRGGGSKDWTGHGSDVEGSDRIWTAVLGPDTEARGLVSDAELTQGQAAATVAALLGLDFTQTGAAPPIPGITD